MSEESRAAEYRREKTARAAWEREQRFRAFPGDATAREALEAAWEPVSNKDRTWDYPTYEGTGEIVHTPVGPRRVGEGLQIP